MSDMHVPADSAWQPNDFRMFTMGHAHLTDIERALELARAFLRGETPEGGTREEARIDALEKVRDALNNHVAAVRGRLRS